ncbi:unnamed protein product [Amoebophrya sp. A25]|nr:unnamed protein product [Amoebophrya sp. A25]|eukprot:GSA25T00022572001.1
MYTAARGPDLNDLMFCEDRGLSRGSGNSPETMFPLCVGRQENTDLTVMGWNNVNVEIKLDSVEVARRRLPGGNTPDWYVWCYSASGCSSNRCVMPPTWQGLKIQQTKSDSPYITDVEQKSSSVAGEKVSVGVKVDNINGDIAAAARLKIVDPQEDSKFVDRVSSSVQLAELFGIARRKASSRGRDLQTAGSVSSGASRALVSSSSSKPSESLHREELPLQEHTQRRRRMTTGNVTFTPCNKFQLTVGVKAGLQCGTRGTSKCEPAGVHDVVSGTIEWPNIEITQAGMFDMCYCDRHRDNTCLNWVTVGELKVDGPLPNPPTQWANPGVTSKFDIHGIELSSRDRIHIIGSTFSCGNPTNANSAALNEATANSTLRRHLQAQADKEARGVVHAISTVAAAAATPSSFAKKSGGGIRKANAEGAIASEVSAERRGLGLIWTSSVPIKQNSSYLQYEVTLPTEARYKMCYCPGSLKSCSSHSDFGVFAGYLEVAQRVDCELSDFWIVEACDKPCGGGTKKKRRRVVQQPRGGGTACPSNAEVLISEICNSDPCPLLRVSQMSAIIGGNVIGSPDVPAGASGQAVVSPGTRVYMNEVFQLKLRGEFLEPEADRVLFIDAGASCGSTQQLDPRNLGGATCDFVGSTMEQMVCGDGQNSIRLESAGRARVCICDASAAMMRNADGSGFMIAGALEMEGTFGAGCDDPRYYLLGGQVIDVINRGAYTEEGVLVGGMAPGLFAFLMVLLSLFVLTPMGYFSWKKYKNQIEAKYVKHVDPFMPFNSKPEDAAMGGQPGPITGTAPEKKPGLIARAKNLLGLTDGKDELSADDEHQAMLLAWDEYYQSLGYPPGTAFSVLGPQLNGTGPSPQQAALANAAYDPNDIFGGYGPTPYAQQEASIPPQPPQPALLALGYDGYGGNSHMSEFLEQSFTNSLPGAPNKSPSNQGDAAKSRISPLSTFVDKVRRASVQMAQQQDGGLASPMSSQPVTPRVPGKAEDPDDVFGKVASKSSLEETDKHGEKPGSTGSTSTVATQSVLPPVMPKVMSRPPPVLPVIGAAKPPPPPHSPDEGAGTKKPGADDELSTGSFLSASNSPVSKRTSPGSKKSSPGHKGAAVGGMRLALDGIDNRPIDEERDESQLSPKSARLRSERKMLDSTQEMIKEQLSAEQAKLEEEHKTREEAIRSKLTNLKQKRADRIAGVSPRSEAQQLPNTNEEALKKAQEDVRRQKEQEEEQLKKKAEEAERQKAAEEAEKQQQIDAEKLRAEEQARKQKEEEALRKRKLEEEEQQRRQKEEADKRERALEEAARKKREEEAAKRKALEEEKGKRDEAEAARRNAEAAGLGIEVPSDTSAPSSVAERRYGKKMGASPLRDAMSPPLPPPAPLDASSTAFSPNSVAARRYGGTRPPPPPPGIPSPSKASLDNTRIHLEASLTGSAGSPGPPPGIGGSSSGRPPGGPSLFDQALAAGMGAPGSADSPSMHPNYIKSESPSPIKKGKFSLGNTARTGAGGAGATSPRFQNQVLDRSSTNPNHLMALMGGGASPVHASSTSFGASGGVPPGRSSGGLSSPVAPPGPPSGPPLAFGGKTPPPPPPTGLGGPSRSPLGASMGAPPGPGGMRPPPPPPPPGMRR